MRIRSLVPKFWESEDIEQHSWDTRLVFIGLWSYADDNGVGRDDPRLIAADLFPLADDPRECRARVSRGLQALFDGGQITRYTVDGAPMFFIIKWDLYQRVDRPGKQRYPRPTCEDSEITIEIAKVSRNHRESPATGEGEKGRRGEGEKVVKAPSAEPMTRTPTTIDFDEFWKHYPRKVSKDAARRAFANAVRRKINPQLIIDGARRYAADPNLPDMEFVPHPPKWINDGRWNDPPCVARTNGRAAHRPSTTDQSVNDTLEMGRRYVEQENREEQERMEIEA